MANLDAETNINSTVLNEIVNRIVAIAHPDKIVLFGSAARGTKGPESDLDLLVIKSGTFHRRSLAQNIHMNLWGIEEAVDVVVVTPEDIAQYRNDDSYIIAPALREGRVIYGS
jgi:predicted nucleotidyltransferase